MNGSRGIDLLRIAGDSGGRSSAQGAGVPSGRTGKDRTMKLRHLVPLFAFTLSCAASAATAAAPSDKELQQFVAASVEVSKINSASLARREAAQTAAAAEKLEDEATAQMEKAVQAQGLTADRYAEIFTVMQSDPAVKAKVAELAKPHRK
jgi:hypothetical protein